MNIRRYYNQNRKMIWGVVIIIVSAFILVRLLINTLDNNMEKGNVITNQEENINDIKTETAKLTTNKSVVTGKDVSGEKIEEAVKVIDEFIKYCNNREIEKAYSLISEDCKKEIFDSLEVFENGYYNDIFDGEQKTCDIENWLGNTYKVRIMNDALSTGKSSNGFAKEDYITTIKEDGKTKLNINGYIGYEEIGKITEEGNIKMEVVGKSVYREYEKYIVKVKNNTGMEIVLDDLSGSKTMYLENNKKGKYPCYNHEMTTASLTIRAGQEKKVRIKFYSSYSSSKKIERIVFSKLQLNDGDKRKIIVFNANV